MKNLDLADYIGGTARLWDFSPSHDRFAVRIESPSGETRFLILSGCNEISAPIFWRLMRPEIRKIDDPWLEFRDATVHIVCQDVVLDVDYSA